MPDLRLPALFVVAGLVGAATPAAAATPPPGADVAQLQLRAINHRLVGVGPAAGPVTAPEAGHALIDALIHADFLATRSDGAWLSRAEFIGQRRAVPDGATVDDEPVRLFGPVALVHGVFTGGAVALRYTDVYLWSGSGWQLVSTQDSPLKPGVALARLAGVAPSHAPWSGQDPTGDDPAVLAALNESYVHAFREADVAWYDAHLAPDYIVIGGDGAYKDRAAALAAFALPTFATSLQSFPVDRVQVRRFGDVALIHARNAYTLKDGRTGESRYTDIWHQVGGHWRCIAAHITAHTLPGPPPRP